MSSDTRLLRTVVVAGDARRLTPDNCTDYSPALSPDGKLLAAATGSGKTGESDVVVMQATDGQNRRLVARNGGWPTFSADGRTLFFHRQDAAGRCAAGGPGLWSRVSG